MADSKNLLKVAEFGLDGNRDALIEYLQDLAVSEVNRNRRGLYNGINELLEKYVKKSSNIETSVARTEGAFDFDISSFWTTSRVHNQIDRFITFYKNHKNIKNSRALSHLNKLLLYGAPGTGKTTIGFYIGNRLELPVRYIKISDVMSFRFGETQRNISELFSSPNPEIIFIDEFDAFAKSREDSQDVGELKRIVNSIIQTLDFQAKGKIVIVATNLVDSLDSAILRRFPFKIHVDFLELSEARDFFLFLVQNDYHEDTIRLSAVESEILISLGDLKTIDSIKILFDKALVQASILSKKEVNFGDFLEVLVSDAQINKTNLKELKKRNPEKLESIGKILKERDFTQEQIANLFGIHRNTYPQYFGK